MGVVEKNRIIELEHELACIRIKNAKYDYFFRNLSEKVAFNIKTPIETEFDKGFNRACTYVQDMLEGSMINKD